MRLVVIAAIIAALVAIAATYPGDIDPWDAEEWVTPTPALYDCADPGRQIYCQPTRQVPPGAAQWLSSTSTPLPAVPSPTPTSSPPATPTPEPTATSTATPTSVPAATSVPPSPTAAPVVAPTAVPEPTACVPLKHSHPQDQHSTRQQACATPVAYDGYVHEHGCRCDDAQRP